MNRDRLKQRIAELITEVLGLDEEEQVNLNNEEGYSVLRKWTSSKHAEIIVAVEDEYDIEVENREIPRLNNLAKIIEYVQNRI